MSKRDGDSSEIKAGRRHSAADVALINQIKGSAADIISAADDLGADEPGAGDGERAVDSEEAGGKSVKAKEAITKKEGDQSCTADCYLVVEDEFKPDTWHLRVKDEDGTPNHTLMGAAWAALQNPNGYRGQKYEGPDKDKAISKLKQLYKDEDMPLPEDKSVRTAQVPPQRGEPPLGRVTIKAKTADTLILGGYGVVFGGEDLVGDTFDKSTNFWLNDIQGPRPVLYEHGLDDRIDLSVLGKTVKMEVDDWGLWVEAEIERNRQYVKEVEQLVEAGVLGWSSGSAGHMVRREVGGGKSVMKSWPILEFSLTPTPAEPRTLGVQEVRAVKKVMNTLRGMKARATRPVSRKALTLDEQADAVEDAIEQALALAFPDSDWAKDEAEDMYGMLIGSDDDEDDCCLYIYTDSAVAKVGVAYWQIPYSIQGGQVVVADRSTWQMVDMNWQPAPTRSLASSKEEEWDMTPEELKTILTEVASTVAVQAATAASEATAAKMREMFDNEPPVKTVGVAAPNIHIRKEGEPLDDLKAFRLWMGYGHDSPPAVMKAMRRRYTAKPVGEDMAGDDDELKATLGESAAPGAYWVPTGLAQQIGLPLANLSYLRKAGANVMNNMVGYDPFNVPVLTYSGRASIGGESSQYVPDEPTSTQVSFIPYKLKKLAKATEEMVEDSRYDVWNMILAPDWEQSFAEGENYYFTLGTGSGQPQGVVAGATTGVTAASTTVFTADELIGLYYSVDPKYRDDPSFAWMANDAVLAVIRKFKDGRGDYLWQPGFGATPDRLLGKPVVWNNQMSSALTTGQSVLLAGAFRYYWISDWPGLQVQRLTEVYSETGEVGFRGFRRVDGHIMQAAAFRKLVLA